MVSRLLSMQVFCAVVEEGAFARAARRMRLSNAAVSRHVSALEDDLETRLLHRTTRRLSMTPEGTIYYERSRAILEEIEGLERELRHEGPDPVGTLRVAAPMTFGLARISPIIGSFCEAFPHVEVELALSDRMVDLVADGVDVAIRVAQSLPESSFVAARLAPFERVLVAAPEYLERRGAPQHPGDLESHACVRFLQLANPDVWVFERDGEEVRVRVSGPLSTNNSLAMVDALVDGIGLALVPAVAVSSHVDAGRLRRCLSAWQPRARSVFAVYPTRRHLNPRVRAFVDFVRSAFAAESAPRRDVLSSSDSS